MGIVLEHKNFEFYKELFYKKWLEAKNKKEVDEQIIGLIELINKHEDFYTTSSCYGRITLSISPLNAKKYDHKFLAKWHYKVSFEEFIKVIRLWENNIRKDILWLKVYPFILHVGVRNLEKAYKLVKVGIEAGMKESGIFELGKRIMVRIEGVDKLEVALGKDGNLWVNEEFLRKELEVANSRFMRNVNKIIRFTKGFLKSFFSKY